MAVGNTLSSRFAISGCEIPDMQNYIILLVLCGGETCSLTSRDDVWVWEGGNSKRPDKNCIMSMIMSRSTIK